MKFIFFGTPKFAAIVLEKIIEAGLKPTALVCNSDEPIGRKKIITAPAAKQLLLDKKINIPVFQPKKLSEIKTELKNINADVFIVAAYNKIISEEIINIPKFKTIGVHPSLLPAYRGPSPIQTAILNGDKKTGIDLFLIDKEVDHGPILANTECEIAENDNYETMTEKLANLGAKLIINELPKYLAEEIKPLEQNHEKATFTKKFLTKDGFVELPVYLTDCHSRESGNPESEKTWIPGQARNDKAEKASAELIFNKIRALNPDPGVFTLVNTKNGQKRLKLLEAALNDGKLELLRVQPEGKKPMSYKDFLNGLKDD